MHEPLRITSIRNYNLKNLKKVKTVTIDMNAGYVNVINEILDYDEDLKTHYHLYQSLLEHVKEKNFTALSEVLNTVNSSLYLRYMKTSIKTLKKLLPYIRHSLMYQYNNGRTEGTNNKIKVLNRVAYGYRNLHNFKRSYFRF